MMDQLLIAYGRNQLQIEQVQAQLQQLTQAKQSIWNAIQQEEQIAEQQKLAEKAAEAKRINDSDVAISGCNLSAKHLAKGTLFINNELIREESVSLPEIDKAVKDSINNIENEDA